MSSRTSSGCSSSTSRRASCPVVASPPTARARRNEVDRAVEPAAEPRTEPTDVAEIVGQLMTCRNGELHSTLARDRRLAEEQGGDDGVADVPDDGRREGLLHERRTVD